MERLTSFLKRRWFLFPCAFVTALMTCFTIQCEIVKTPNGYDWTVGKLGLYEGELYYWDEVGAYWLDTSNPALVWYIGRHTHRPRIGGTPKWNVTAFVTEISIPLWLPLSVFVGFLTFRELRWREMQAKAAERSLNHQPSTINYQLTDGRCRFI